MAARGCELLHVEIMCACVVYVYITFGNHLSLIAVFIIVLFSSSCFAELG